MKNVIFSLSIIFLFATACDNEEKTKNFDGQFSSESRGCGSFVVYKVNDTNDMAIAVIGSRESLNLSMTEQTFDLSKANANNLKVEILKFATKASLYYCDDVAGDEITDKWVGKSGQIKIVITEDYIDDNPQFRATYKINVKIENVILENNDENKIIIGSLAFKDVTVGWSPG
jgi:uncharacterized lipoprotein YehR (DUF1307 family)